VALIPNCAATRHIHFTLDGSGVADLPSPKLEDWPVIEQSQNDDVIRMNLETATKADFQKLKSGDNILLSGKILTGRDAAHKRLKDMYEAGEEFPVNLKDKFIYYVGPVDPVGDEVVGPAGPTTATRMDKFTPFMLEDVGVMGMIGKSERGQATIDSIKKNKAVYLMGVGGAAYLISKSIKQAKVVGFEDLGMEAIYEFEVEDMPVTVAVDSQGVSAHQQGPKMWKAKIAEIKKV
jgi:fumarate hydratase class I